MDFKAYGKIPRLSRDMVITEKIDGTNAAIYIGKDGEFLTGKRTNFCTPEKDNYGFSQWAHANKEELMKLGPGIHYGEWWGNGIQRRYGLTAKRFSLFNVHKWTKETTPLCCHVVPVLYTGPFSTEIIDMVMASLEEEGSRAAPGFMKPEGVVIYHTASGTLFKKTFENDKGGKG